jgi:hypothetical protein
LQLQDHAQKIVRLLRTEQNSDRLLRDAAVSQLQIRFVGMLLDAQLAVVNQEGRVLFSNYSKEDYPDLNVIQHDPKWIVERLPVFNDRRQTVVLFTEVKEIAELRKLILYTQVGSMLAGGILTLLLGWWTMLSG